MLEEILADRRIERQLHLVDRHAVRRQSTVRECSPPSSLGFAEHAGDEIDVDLGKTQVARFLIDAHDLGRAVGAAVGLEDAVAEVLDAEAEPRHSDAANRRQLRTSDGTGLALEGDLLRRVPGAARRHPLDEGLELARREERGVPPPK